MENDFLNNPNYKTGVKILTESQMRMGLPLYDTLLNKIERVRYEATLVDRSMLLRQSFENLKYDQIFSILGGRGAGKTSVLMTLRHELEQGKHNVIFPIIMPELIEDDESIVSWIISAMKENLEKVENTISNFGYKNNSEEYQEFCKERKLFDRCAFNHQNRLRQLLNELSNAYYATEFRNQNSTADYATYKELLANGVESSYSLTKKFTKYWNELIDVYTKYLHELHTTNQNTPEYKSPLIFIFIDDADLKPQILNELLFVIPKYLSHPNVVVFVSASQKTLAYSVKNFMYKSITQNTFDLPALMDIEHQYNGNSILDGEGKTIKFHDLRYGREYDKIKKLADEILRKIFPIYNRFYLRKYDSYQDKGMLQMFADEQPDCQNTVKLSIKLTEELKKFKNKIIELHKESILFKRNLNSEVLTVKITSFKLVEETSEYLANEMYISFLGRYSRDISSVYYAFKDALTAMVTLLENYYANTKKPVLDEMSEEFIESMYEIVTKFITAAVDSNRNLTMFSRSVRDLVKMRLLHWQLYVDYAKILDIFKEERYFQGNKNHIEPFVEMFCLLNLVEQLIVLVIPQRKTTHGYEEFPHLLQLCGIEIVDCKPYIKKKDIYNMLNQFFTFYKFDIIPRFDINRLEHRKSFIRGVESLGIINDDQLQFLEITKNAFLSSKWYDMLISSFISTYTVLSVVPQYKSELFVFSEKLLYLDKYYLNFQKKYSESLKRVFLWEDIVKEKPNEKTMRIIETQIIDLNTAIDSLYLVYNIASGSKNKTTSLFNQLIRQAEYIDIEIALYANRFFNRFVGDSPIRRRDFLIELGIIEQIAKNSEESLSKEWFDDFTFELRKCFVILTNGIEYDNYKQACENLGKSYESYIAYYASIIFGEYKGNTSNEYKWGVEKNLLLKENLPQKYAALQYKEWCRIIEME